MADKKEKFSKAAREAVIVERREPIDENLVAKYKNKINEIHKTLNSEIPSSEIDNFFLAFVDSGFGPQDITTLRIFAIGAYFGRQIGISEALEKEVA